MPTYTLDELIKIMEPQARRDKALINKCLEGLEVYAAQQVQTGNNKKVEELRGLVDTLVGYWGLDDGGKAKPLEEYLASFDNFVADAKAGAGFSDISLKGQENTIYGLFRYGTEMVSAQGSDAVFDILHISALMKEIAASWQYESDVLDNMTGQLEAEVQKMGNRKELMNECAVGLGRYAAQQVKENYFSSKPEEIRKLIENIHSYWGFDDSENTPPLDDLLNDFEEKIHAAKYRKEVDKYLSSEFEVGTLYGLYCYGEDMTLLRGNDAMFDILDVSDLMDKIAMYWEFEPLDAVTDMSNKLRNEVRSMLNDITLPGQPGAGANVGYHIQQAILFDNDRGFVLAHHPKAPSPYVTWTFTDRDGKRGYDIGDYHSTEERAKLSYLSRVSDYMEAYKVAEKLVTTAAVVTTDNPIPVKVLSADQPLVTVTFSEDEQLRNIIKMPLYLANTVFFEADEKQNAKYFAALRGPEPIGHYLKTDFRIDFTMNGEADSYSGRYDIGIGDQTLTEHIQEHAEYYRNDESHQSYLDSTGEKETANAQYDTILNELVPFFDKHCELSSTEAHALSELMGIHKDAEGNPSDSAKIRIEYLEAVVENVWRSRAALNGRSLGTLSERLHLSAELADGKSGKDEKTSVLDKIKASRTAPKPPPKSKQENNKKKHGQEL